MVKSPEKYEELRRQRLEENKKRMEELNIPLLSQALLKTPSPKTTPKPKPRTFRTELVPVRRSSRFTNEPLQEHFEIVVHERVQLPRRIDLPNQVYASDKGRAKATIKAEELKASLGSDYPTFVKPMLQSHVNGRTLGLSSYFCKRNLPDRDDTITLVDEHGEEWPTVYLARKTRLLCGGWKKFAVDHDLVDGDALVFQLIRTTAFKVYIIRVSTYEEGTNLNLEVLN